MEDASEIPSVEAQREMTAKMNERIKAQNECRWTALILCEMDSWATQCDCEHYFVDGGPDENKYKFCPYCGGKLVAVAS